MLGANNILMDAFYTDVRPALADWRESRGLPRDPFAAYLASGYQEQIEADRVGGQPGGLGRLSPDVEREYLASPTPTGGTLRREQLRPSRTKRCTQ